MTTDRIFILAAASALLASCQGGDAPANNQTAAADANAAAPAAESNIGETLAGSQEHSTLVAALKQAGLDKTMTGSQPYTVFAPTNGAFDKLPGGASESLMQPQSKGQLTGILTYHIVPGTVTAKDLAAAIERKGGKAEIATMGGTTLSAAEENGAIVLTDAKGNKARITRADLLQSNGVVHVVDGVLTPG